MIEEKVIWMPQSLINQGYDFKVLLDRDFAKEMLSTKITSGKARNFNETADRLKLLGFNKSPFLFYEDTAFVSQINSGTDGRWLATSGTSGKNPLGVFKGPIEYYSHNMDSSVDLYMAMRLMDFWVDYSDVLKGS